MKLNKGELDARGSQSVLSAEERAALESNRRRKAAQSTVRVQAALTETNTLQIAIEHADKDAAKVLLAEAFGTADNDSLNGIIGQLANTNSRNGQVDNAAFKLMVSVIKGIKPKDQLESMLAAQMAAVHQAMLTLAGRFAHVETIDELDSTERAFNKLARTFAIQMETLKRYRTGGEQKVTVQHVSVSEGGQAIVGNVTHAARETASEMAANSTPALSHSKEAPMPIIDGERERAPAAAGRGQKVPSRHRRKDVGRSPS
jgi:hypothetical protein